MSSLIRPLKRYVCCAILRVHTMQHDQKVEIYNYTRLQTVAYTKNQIYVLRFGERSNERKT